jgi:hypothetical protein
VPVTLALVVVITVIGCVLAALGLAGTLAGRRIGLIHLAGTGVLEAVLLLQAVLVVVALAGGHRPAELATFLAYLIAVLLVPVAGLLWARTEPTRYAGTVLAVAGVTVAVMGWRLLQLWQATRA